MTRSVVCDASAVVALLTDSGPDGQWVAATLRATPRVAAPALVRFEVSNILRRLEASCLISADQAAQAHADLLELAVEEWPYEAVSARVWQLRSNLTAYDAAYVGLAELLGDALLTLDRRIARAPGVRCPVLTPG